jgi:predicted metal-dependent HD superfamily phosphohydrolase
MRDRTNTQTDPLNGSSLIDEAVRTELEHRYRAPDRHYHGIAHIEALLRLASDYRAELTDFAAVEAAIWFHDAIYDSKAKDNEARSAVLARQLLAGRVAPERLAGIAAMIEATATHEMPESLEPAARHDAALFLDMDLSILGAPPEAFDVYEAAIRREYAWVEDTAWRNGRAAVLRRFLSRPRIFHTETFRRSHEAAARSNIERSLARLEHG